MVEGYEIWHIQCRACGRETTREGGNELVGKHEQLVCKKCGHRGASLTRVWHAGKKEPGTKPG
jgi:rRNA maturation endonuclease Nob1